MKRLRCSLFALCLGALAAATSAADVYPDFAALSRNKKEGVDFVVETSDRRSKVCVLAIHGGKIEEGSDVLARAIAGDDLSFYIFIARQKSRNHELHVTSARFDDPRAVALVKESESCLSIHGFEEDDRDVLCVGGGNDAYRASVAKALSYSGLPLTVETPCARFGGSASSNIVNRGAKGGVQIEISTRLRKKLVADPRLTARLAAILRGVPVP